MKTKAVLQELFELLETYAPAWYTEEQRRRALAALRLAATPGLLLIKPQSASLPAGLPAPHSGPAPSPDSSGSGNKLAKSNTGVYIQ